MAIAQVGTIQAAGVNNGGNVTLTFDGSPAEGHLVLFMGGNGDNDGTGTIGPSTAGYTQRALHQVNDGGVVSGGVWTKFLGASPDTQVVGLGSGNAAEATAYASVVMSDVDQTTPLDISIVETGPISTNPDLAGGTIITDGAWVFLVVISNTSDTAITPPTNYTLLTHTIGTDTRRATITVALRQSVSAGAEEPAAFADWDVGSDGHAFFVVIRPAGAAAEEKLQPSRLITRRHSRTRRHSQVFA